VTRQHPLPFGAEVTDRGIHFSLWAPAAERVSVRLDSGITIPMQRDSDAVFAVTTGQARPGTLYQYEIDGRLYPDPASRFQPLDALGQSEVIDPNGFTWTDAAWEGRPWAETVLYELHIGSFSETGDYAGAIGRLQHLVDLGVTAIEIMPVAECPGRWNWGYDGVLPYAPTRRYGRPEDLKRLVDACHAQGISVLLDVVYNHFGPEGNFLPDYARDFFTDRHRTPWGDAINFDGETAQPVRNFMIDNALYWLEQFHLDGLRLDAVDQIRDDSPLPLLVELGDRVRARITDREIHLVLENYRNQASLLGAELGGRGPHTAQWNDDFHHVLRVLGTGAEIGYYRDYVDHPVQRLGKVLSQGFAYQGEESTHHPGMRRGEDSRGLPPTAFIAFTQNHDQIGNHPYGWRIDRLGTTETIRAMTVILLLAPQIPLLFMGQEWSSSAPFPFFCDFDGELGDAVRKGRRQEFAWHPEFGDGASHPPVADPLAETTFESAKLDWSEPNQPPHREQLTLYRTLIELRRRVIMPGLAAIKGHQPAPRLFGTHGLEQIWQLGDGRKLQLIANLCGAPEPHTPARLAEPIFATHPNTDILPAWFVSFSADLPVP